MLYKKRRSRIHKRIRKIIIPVFLSVLLLIIIFESQAIPFTKKCIKKQAKSISTRIIGDKVEKSLNNLKYTYNDLVEINYSKDGKVNSINTNSIKINKLKSTIIKEIQNELDKEKLYTFSLPLGSFTDLTLLSALGPDISVNFSLTGSINCSFKNIFESGGVNQTVHHMYLLFNCEIIALSPEYSEKVVFKTDYEIAQTVIVGNIPSTYADIVR